MPLLLSLLLVLGGRSVWVDRPASAARPAVPSRVLAVPARFAFAAGLAFPAGLPLPARRALPAGLAPPLGRTLPADLAVPAGPVSAFVWPVDTPHVVRRFDPPPQPWLPGHRGVDLAAPPGSVVRTAGAGTVAYAGTLAGRGVVSIAHPGGLRTTYEPVTTSLRAGDPVTAGAQLGVLDGGHPGCPAEACLHWGLRRGEYYLDPLALLGLGRVRLLPLAS